MASYSSGIQVDIGQIVAEESTAVDWSSKTGRRDYVAKDPYDGSEGIKEILSISGSGYVYSFLWNARTSYDGDLVNFEVEVDGSVDINISDSPQSNDFVKTTSDYGKPTTWRYEYDGLIPFSSGVTFQADRNFGYSAESPMDVVVFYVLD